jgi:hypothetical protein
MMEFKDISEKRATDGVEAGAIVSLEPAVQLHQYHVTGFFLLVGDETFPLGRSPSRTVAAHLATDSLTIPGSSLPLTSTCATDLRFAPEPTIGKRRRRQFADTTEPYPSGDSARPRFKGSLLKAALTQNSMNYSAGSSTNCE